MRLMLANPERPHDGSHHLLHATVHRAQQRCLSGPAERGCAKMSQQDCDQLL